MALMVMLSMLSINFSIAPSLKAAAESSVYFSESGTPETAVTDKTVMAGDDFSLVATVDPGITPNEVSGAELHVKFDPTKFSLTSIDAPAAPSDCAVTPTFSTVLQSPSIDNTNGTGVIALGVCMTTPPSPVVTISPIATFNFHAINGTSGPLPIYFLSSTLVTAIGETESVVAMLTDANVTVDSLNMSAPIISAGLPSGTLIVGTTQAAVSVSTDENATCKYNTGSGLAYDLMNQTFTTTGGTSHSFIVSGLSNGGSYGYFVRCKDIDENKNLSDYFISFTVANPVIIQTSSSSSSHRDEKKKTPKRYVSNSKKKIARGKVLIQRGKKFSKNDFVLLYFSKFGGGYYAPQKIKTSSTGAFTLSYVVNKPIGKYNWYAIDIKTAKKSKTVYYTVK